MVIAVLAGLFWLRKGGNNTVAGAQQVTGLLFFELLFLSLRALFTALFTFPSDFKMVSALSCRPQTLTPGLLAAAACAISSPLDPTLRLRSASLSAA